MNLLFSVPKRGARLRRESSCRTEEAPDHELQEELLPSACLIALTTVHFERIDHGMSG